MRRSKFIRLSSLFLFGLGLANCNGNLRSLTQNSIVNQSEALQISAASQNVWDRAIRKIVVDGWSIERATDGAIEQIKQILSDWK